MGGRLGVKVPFEAQVSMGLWPGYRMVNKFGTNLSVGTSADFHIWAYTGTFRQDFATASTLDVVSDSVADANLLTGAWFVQIDGLDEDYEPIQETVTLDGTNTVTTTQSFLRVNRAFCTEAQPTAVGGSNIGNITISRTTGGAVQAYIRALYGQTQISHYTVPAGRTAFVRRTSVSASSDRTAATIRFMQRRYLGEGRTGADRVWLRVDAPGAPLEQDLGYAISFPEKTDLWATARADSASNSPAVNVEYTLLLVDQIFDTPTAVD